MDKKNVTRIDFVDVLRGFSIIAFIILHNIQHYTYYHSPLFFPNWLRKIDDFIYLFFDFLFGSRTYLIFSTLFGFSFYILMNNQKLKGYDFKYRFIWRLFILSFFSFFNSILFQGDILTMYIINGLLLIFFFNRSNRFLIAIALILLSQIYLWTDFFLSILNPTLTINHLYSVDYIEPILKYLKGDSFIEHSVGNLTYGKIHNLLWSWETGRFFQNFAMFLIGIYLGRTNKFIYSNENRLFWKKGLIYSIFIVIISIFLKDFRFIADNIIDNKFDAPILTYLNLGVALFLTSSLYFIYYSSNNLSKLKEVLIIIGKMSLTAYLMQSIFGALLYYNYGLGLFNYTGGLFCLLISILLIIIQYFFNKWWLKTHKQGPCEALWTKLTWIF